MLSFSIVSGTVAILLAAGASRRMGMPKPLLMVEERPLAEHLAEILLLGGVEQVIMVTSTELEASLQQAIQNPKINVVVNADPSAGMLSSVQAGITEISPVDAKAFLVCPCDFPLLTPRPVYAILHYWTQECHRDPTAIVAPMYAGKRGHPTLFGVGLREEIMGLNSYEVGLNELLKQRINQVREVTVRENGVILDADTPEEWTMLVGSPPVCWRGW